MLWLKWNSCLITQPPGPVKGWGLEYLHLYYPKRKSRQMDWIVKWVMIF